MTATIKINEKTGHSERQFQYQSVPYSKCVVGKNIFYEDLEEINKYSISEFFCPDWHNITLQGSWISPIHKRLELTFKRCELGDPLLEPYMSNYNTSVVNNCASDEEFNSWIRNVTL
jgi:hypothetical protein